MKRNRNKHRKNLRPTAAAGSRRAARTPAAASVGAILLTGTFAVAQVPVYAAGALPIPCPGSASVCKGLNWDRLGTGSTLAGTANSLIVNQATSTAIFNWSSFNISTGNTVQFVQPSTSSVALNRIFDPNVTTIAGNLKANGQVYLINPNGILFGSGANVDVAGLVASTSNLSDARITSGLLYEPLVTDPVFTNDPAALGASAAAVPVAVPGANPSIVVQPGATLYAAGRDTTGTVVSAGRVFLFAPTVEVGGNIEVGGGGQVILAAGSNVYLGSSSDASLRGLLVEVNGSSAAGVSVDASGNINVARGNITLMGLAVNQAGTLTATSALDANGSILLVARQAQSSAAALPADPTVLLPVAQTGTVTLASGSKTVVALDPTDTATAPLNDPTASALQSTIKIEGAAVSIGGNGTPGATLVQAHGGDVSVTARLASSSTATQNYALGDGSLLGASDRNDPSGAGVINVNPDAIIDVSGLQNVAVDSAAYFTYISRLTSTNLANAPYQRSGFLLGQGVWVNLNNVPTWLNVGSLQAAVAGTQAQRDTAGGTVALDAEGAVNLAKGSQINVSGGSIDYTAAIGRVSELVTASGAVVPISANLSADTQYVGIAGQGSTTVSDPFEGITQTTSWQVPTYAQMGGYTAGANAGTIQVYAPAANLGGTLVGQTLTAQQQRSGPPLGAMLQIGSNNVGQLDLEAGIQRANILLAGTDASLQQGLAPDLAAATGGAPTIGVNTTNLAQEGFTRLDLTSDGAIELAPGSPLNLGPGGSFVARGNALAIDSSITAPGGNITLSERPLAVIPGGVSDIGAENTQRDAASLIPESSLLRGSVRLGQGTSFSVAGLWTNDLAGGPQSVPSAPVVLNGGAITVSGRTVDASGASFDVSAGATLTQKGGFSGGSAGSLTISAMPSDPTLIAAAPGAPQLDLGTDFAARIAGYGVGGGGSLTLAAYALQLGPGPSANPAATLVDTGIGNTGFQSFHFNGYELTQVAAGAQFAPQVTSFANSYGLDLQASAADLRSVATPQAPLPGVAVPVAVGLKAGEPFAGTVGVGAGATIDAGIGGSISLTGGADVQVDGRLRAPAGSVALALAGRSLDSSLTLAQLDARSIQLGPDATLDVSGASLVVENANGLRTGNVLAAGSVSIDAPLGTVALDPGAQVLAHGTSDTVDLRLPNGQYQAQTVASAGGTVEMSATNGLYLEGSIDAHGGNAVVNGGALSIALNASAVNSAMQPDVQAQLAAPTELVVGGSGPALGPAQASFAAPVDENGLPLSGQATVPGAVVNASGFEQVWLQAADTIHFAQTTKLSAPGLASLVLAAPMLSIGANETAQLAAPYVALGAPYGANPNSSLSVNGVPVPVPASGGTGALQVQAQNIDLIGNLGLEGIGSAQLQASGDLRVIGILGVDGVSNPTRASGSLSFGGNLDISAGQMYPATRTDFAFEFTPSGTAADASNGQLVVASSAPAGPAPLSAGGSLRFDVNGFTAAGTVLAPLGSIAVNANSITLEPGSVLSVAGSGLVPYGSVSNGTTWTYAVPPGYAGGINDFTIASSAGATVAAKGIALNAPAGALNAQAGSTINLAGGGDVLGIGFVSGTGGTYDMALNQPYGNATPNPFFALIPSRGTAVAPYDPQIYNGLSADAGLARTSQTFAMGQTITIGAGSPIPAGTYTLLPAAYAVLPGAYAMETVGGYQNLLPGSSVAMPDGTTVVPGKLGFAAVGTAAGLWSGYRVYSDAQFRMLSEFDNYYGSAFFAAAAAQAGQPVARLGQDAGSLQIAASAITLSAAIDAAPSAGGRGADIAIDAPDIVVADSSVAASSPQGTLTLGASGLSALGAESLVLGAVENWAGGALTLATPVAAQSLSVQASSALSAGQVILTAANVSVGAGASVVASSTQTPQASSIGVGGDGAALVVSNAGSLPTWTRSGASAPGTATTGNLAIASGASVRGASVIFDGTGSQSYGSGMTLAASRLGLSAAQFNVGTAPGGTSGLDLTPGLLALFGSVGDLTLTSAGGIDAYGSATLGQLGSAGTPLLNRLTLVGPGIAGFGAAGDVLAINAGHVTLDNGAGAITTSTGSGAGTLVVQASALGTTGDGSIAIAGPVSLSGFHAVSLSAVGSAGASGGATQTVSGTGDLVFTGGAGSTAALDVAGSTASLSIDAARVTADAGVNAAIHVPGALTIAASGPAPAAAQSQLGASLAITAQNFTDSGRIDLPAGAVSIDVTGGAASDGIALENGASIRVGGLTKSFASASADVSAGSVAMTSASGSIAENAGATIDLSGAGQQGDAGSLQLSALQGAVSLEGTVLASAGANAQGARYSIEAGNLADFSALASTLGTASGASTAGSIRLRALGGNIAVQAGDRLKAGSIQLEADGAGGATDGSVQIAGVLDASGANGGNIAVYANDQIAVQGGALVDAHATGAGGNGGAVTLSARVGANPASTADAIVLQSGSVIDVAGGAGGNGGTVLLRAPRINGSDVAVTANAGAVVQGARAGELVVDAVQVYQPAAPLTTAANVNAVLATAQADASAFMSAAAPTGLGALAGAQLRPGIEVDTPGAITISTLLDFASTNAGGAYAWRYGGSTLSTSVPGELTLRAGAGITLAATISDGFAATAALAKTLNGAVATSGDSWSYTFTAGADLAAANPNRTGTTPADLTIGTESATKPVTVRTGTGTIALNASQDVILDNGAGQQSNVVYTAGVANVNAVDGSGNPLTFPVLNSTPGTVKTTTNVVLTQYGGDLSISAGRDVLGTATDGSNVDGSTQNVNEWLLRGGLGTKATPAVWWVDFGQFQQGFGVLGGGNLDIQAGGNVTRVGAVVASNGYDAGAGLSQRNTGSLRVAAGGSIVQGLYYDQAGAFDLTAATLASNPASSGFADIRLAQGDNGVNIQARDGASVETAFNPTIFAASLINTKKAPAAYQTEFFTFGDASAFEVRTAAGDLTLAAFGSVGSSLLSTQNVNVTAPDVTLVSFSGNVAGNGHWLVGGGLGNNGGLLMYPSASGQLQILAAGSISQLPILMSQADPALLPQAAAPSGSAVSSDVTYPLTIASFNGNSGASLHANDPSSAEIVALTGSITNMQIQIPKTTEIVAGQDIGPLSYIDIQNSNAGSLTKISAGNEINFVGQSNIFDGINIGGPGAAQITAGGTINLGTDGTGITSRGNLDNVNLPAAGATLIVTAGAGRAAGTGLAAQPDYANLAANFVQYDAFAASGVASAALNQQVVAQLGADPALMPFAAALGLGLNDRAAAAQPNSAFAQALAALTPAQLAVGGVKLASAIQVVNNQIFVGTANSESFAPAYAALGDLFPALNNNAGAIRDFVLNDVFTTSTTSGAALQAQALAGLPASLAQAIRLGLAAPASVSDPNSAFSQALAAIDPATLAAGARALLANVLAVAGQSRDALQASGSLTGSGSPYAKALSGFARSFAPTAAPGLNDLQMDFSQIKAQETGSVAVLAPQGAVIVGQASPPSLDIAATLKTPDQLGIFTYGGGDIIGMARDSVNVFQSRVFTVAGGDIDLWSSLANIDAGRGSRDLAVVPPPRLVVASNGTEQLDVSSTVTGSGIGALVTQPDQPPSNINLMAPAGYVDAGEAGIRAQSGTVVLGTNLVLNAGNIQAASGVSGGAVVASPPPPAPPSTGTSSGERAVEDAQRSAIAQQQAAAAAANATHVRITGEFIGFETDCPDGGAGGNGSGCAAGREPDPLSDRKP
jgi:filamentous hemagglutinin